ncbi:MAG: cysteine desulfurase family protein [Nanoarchaeota archaeon]
MDNIIYLDNASTTYVDPRVKIEIDKYFCDEYGNPGSSHEVGRKAKNALENSRETIARIINSSPQEIIFTSGGTESINLALQGVAKALKSKGKHIVTTKLEHPAVLETCKFLESEGFEISFVAPEKNGVIDPEKIKQVFRADTILVSVMYANNEIGTIQPIATIGKICREKNIYFHTDACQAGGSLPINVNNLNVDLLTLNSSKFYGPKGCGILFVRKGTQIEPLIYGGGQEQKLRSGTENIPSIIGFAKALEIAELERKDEFKRLKILRDKLIEGLLKIPGSSLNGDALQRLPNNVSIRFNGVEAEAVLSNLDMLRVCASTGSTCSTKKLEPSYVLTAIGLSPQECNSTIRFTLGRKTTNEEIDKVINVMPEIIGRLRNAESLLTLKRN